MLSARNAWGLALGPVLLVGAPINNSPNTENVVTGPALVVLIVTPPKQQPSGTFGKTRFITRKC